MTQTLREAAAALADLARRHERGDGAPVVIGIAGAVASGKSTLASAIRDTQAGRGDAVVVGTDGFLLPNSTLSERGLLAHKGFPESYDVAALVAFVDAVRSGVRRVSAPRYSHITYDVEPGAPLDLDGSQMVLVEGLNALGALAGRLDVGVYVDADERDLERWYVTRFLELRREAETDPSSFYRRFLGMSSEETESLARHTWRAVNLVNLREHIAPTRALADVVVVKGRDHGVVRIERADRGPRR